MSGRASAPSSFSATIFNDRSGTVIAVVVNSQAPRAGFPLTLELTSVKMPKRSWVKISQIRTLSVERLSKKLGRVSPEELEPIVDGVNDRRVIEP